MKQLCIEILVFGFLSQAAAQSPYELSRDDVWLVAAGLGLTAAGVMLDRSLTPLSLDDLEHLDPTTIFFLDRPVIERYSPTAAHWSDVLGLSCVAAPPLMLLDGTVRDDWQTYGVMYAETLFWNTGLVLLTKTTVRRLRPFVFGARASDAEKLERDARMAFYSGHTSTAFASAVFFAKTYGDYFPESSAKNVVWAGAIGLAGSVGYLRVAAGKHYWTDVIAGALIGGAIGYWLPELHRTESTKSSAPMHLSLSFRF